MRSISELTRRETPSGCDGKQSYACPDQVYKRRRISAIKDRVRGEEKAANDVKKLIGH
jgi:hypothetical protein